MRWTFNRNVFSEVLHLPHHLVKYDRQQRESERWARIQHSKIYQVLYEGWSMLVLIEHSKLGLNSLRKDLLWFELQSLTAFWLKVSRATNATICAFTDITLYRQIDGCHRRQPPWDQLCMDYNLCTMDLRLLRSWNLQGHKMSNGRTFDILAIFIIFCWNILNQCLVRTLLLRWLHQRHTTNHVCKICTHYCIYCTCSRESFACTRS